MIHESKNVVTYKRKVTDATSLVDSFFREQTEAINILFDRKNIYCVELILTSFDKMSSLVDPGHHKAGDRYKNFCKEFLVATGIEKELLKYSKYSPEELLYKSRCAINHSGEQPKLIGFVLDEQPRLLVNQETKEIQVDITLFKKLYDATVSNFICYVKTTYTSEQIINMFQNSLIKDFIPDSNNITWNSVYVKSD